MNIMSLNGGSSTLKYTLFAMPAEDVLAEGSLDHPGGDGILQAAQQAIETCRGQGIDAVGHRVVHGGATFTQPTRMTNEKLADLRTLQDLDPLHNPIEVAMIEAALRLLPDAPIVAVFDTAFHQTLPEVAWRYALPRQWSDRLGLRRYGFHGISYRYVSERLLQSLGRPAAGSRLIICHLGSGASICALRDGQSMDTSMGMTPLEGLVMGTRSGDVDPGLLLYLLRSAGMTADSLNDILNRSSGLIGISGHKSGDVRRLEQASIDGDNYAALSLEIFAYRVRKYIGAYAAALGGLDAVAFTGGIGEHSASLREKICTGLDFLGLYIDDTLNQAASGREAILNGTDAPVSAWVIPTDEQRQIARETHTLVDQLS
jgi:acetate kinase